jgi:DNA-binding NtrC family response regulator
MAYAWPGNVRELASVIERAAILGNGNGLEVAQALGVQNPPMVADASGAGIREDDPKPQTLDQVARHHIEAILTRTLGRIEGPFGAARLLGVNPHTLRARMRKLGIDWRRFRPHSGEPR